MLLVASGSTRLGRAATLSLAAAGSPVRALVRDPERASDLKEAGAEVVAGDLAWPRSLDAALEGVEAAILTSPPTRHFPELDRNFVEAAQRSGLRRLVKCSAAAADPASPDVFSRMHWEGERLIQASGIPHTFVRPVFLMQNLRDWAAPIREDRRFCTPLPESAPLAMVDLRDVALVAANALVEDGHEGRSYVVINPSLLTCGELAEKLTEATGSRIEYFQGDRSQFVDQMLRSGVERWTAESVGDIYDNMDEQRAIALRQISESPLGFDAIEKLGGRRPRSVDEFLEENVDEFRPFGSSDAADALASGA